MSKKVLRLNPQPIDKFFRKADNNNNKQYFQQISPPNTKLIRVVFSNSQSNWNLEMLIFVEGRKPENPEKNPRSKGENQQQTQPTYDAWSESNPGHIGGRRALSPLRHACSHKRKQCSSSLNEERTGNESAILKGYQKIAHDSCKVREKVSEYARICPVKKRW